METNTAVKLKLATYSTYESREAAALARLRELGNDPEYKTDPTFIRNFLDAKTRLRAAAKGYRSIEDGMAALDRFGLALRAFERHLSKLHTEWLADQMTLPQP